MVAKVVAKLIYHKNSFKKNKKTDASFFFYVILPEFPFYRYAFLRFRERRRFLRGVSPCTDSSLMMA